MTETSQFLKSKGNEAYTIQEYTKASEFYEKALTKTTDPVERLPLYLNLAMSKIYEGKYVEGRNICDHALHLDSKSVKGLYRRGLSYHGMCEYDQAMMDFARVLELEPNNEAAKLKLEFVKNEMTLLEKKEKKVYKNMFSEELYPDKKRNSSKFWYYMIVVYILLITIVAAWYYGK